MRILTILILIASSGALSAGPAPGRVSGGCLGPLTAQYYFQPDLQKGSVLSNIFSRTNSYKGEGFDELARRISGTATYTVTAATSDDISFDLIGRYDGRPESRGTERIRDGGRTDCYDGKCSPSLEASGVLYNPLLWGMPSGNLRKGMSWTVKIPQPWELGPSGEQTITVISLDPRNGMATLERKGAGSGFFASDSRQVPIVKDGKSYIMEVVPGRSRWIGYTTFRKGVVWSDELLVTRPVILKSETLGSLAATERQYILLNAMPPGAYP